MRAGQGRQGDRLLPRSLTLKAVESGARRLLHFNAPQVLKIPAATRTNARDAANTFELRSRSHRPTAIRAKSRKAALIVIALNILQSSSAVYTIPVSAASSSNLRYYSTAWLNQRKLTRYLTKNGDRCRFDQHGP